jgi:p-hydroxybenzoate 3-monooxygenase
MIAQHTQVAIVGAGPAGLLLAHLLAADGVDVVVIERRSPEYVLGRIRAGVLETVTTGLMERLGLDARLKAEGMSEAGFNLADGDRLIRIDLERLTGRDLVVYGQTELTRDLMEAAQARGLRTIYEADNVELHDLTTERPFVTFTQAGEPSRIDAEFIAGCDGFHGPSRQAVPDRMEYERQYPFGWLGILADVPPCHPELIYASSEKGFALASMRSPTRSRYYIQVPLTDRLENWSEERLWDELEERFDGIADRPVARGPALEMSIAPLRSFVCETMRYGRLFLAGDAAHIVPPTGAKGLNLAASDVHYLSEALLGWFKRADAAGLDQYPERALRRIWKADRFSWQLTNLMHRFPDATPFERKMQEAELDYVAGSEAMQRAIAENYIGLPL